MGIVKIRRQGPRKDNDALQCPLTLDEFVQEGRLPLPNDPINELHDDSELSDSGCECAIVNEQICNVPYELFELPNFKEILSLEIWNLCLTEEERFHLAAYLPDMDQETFGLTMSELLGGANFFFGSPLEILFHRLSGGFYSLQVSQFREGLKLLNKQVYYHSLRSYHDRMGLKIVEMRRAWSNCQPNTTVKERVQILNDMKSRKPVLLVDLNAVPSDEELSSQGLTKVEVGTDVPAMDSNVMASNRKKTKGFLKIKPLEMNSKSNHTVFQHQTDSRESFNRPPKGVLKIRPKGYPTSLIERAMVTSVPPDKSFDGVFGIHSPLHFVSKLEEESLNRKFTYLYHSNQDWRFNRGSPTPELANGQQSEETRNIVCYNSLPKMKRAKGMTMCTDDQIDLGECFTGQHSRALYTNSAGLYQPVPGNYQRKIMQVHTDVSEPVSRNSTSVTNDYQLLSRYHDRSENRYNGESVRSSRMYPITYKRKKSYTQLSAVQNFIQPSIVASMEPLAPTAADLRQAGKAKSMKIRVKKWNQFPSQ